MAHHSEFTLSNYY